VLQQSWFEALDSPGAAQMTIMRNLVESLAFDRWLPAQELVAHSRECGDDCLDDHRQARDGDGEFAIVYLTSGGSETVDLSSLRSSQLLAAWFDPRKGCLHGEISELVRADGAPVFTAPTSGNGCDWVLVIATERRWFAELGTSRQWAQPIQLDRLSMIWA
jgi:hypothetical protein